jgi:sugar phosphate isomerase/epimerase
MGFNMKIGVSTYSYLKLTRSGMTLEEAISKTKELGYTQIELGSLKPPEGSDISMYAAYIRGCCEKAGLEISAYIVGADLYKGGEHNDPAAEVERVKKEVDNAVALGADKLRHDVIAWAFQGPGKFVDIANTIAPFIRDIAEYAAGKGVRTMVENHGYFIQESSRVVALIDLVGHPNFGACVDIGNFLCADEAPIDGVSRLAPYAFHVHVKDFLWKDGQKPSPGGDWLMTRGGHHIRGTILGHGVVPVPQCLHILKNAGYNRGVRLEFEGPEETLHAIEASRDYLLRYNDVFNFI